jgi:hypothetical protein
LFNFLASGLQCIARNAHGQTVQEGSMTATAIVRDDTIDWAAQRVVTALGPLAGEIARAWADHLAVKGKDELAGTWRRVETRIGELH